ncbi:hypothetical protein H0A71_21565 [Alcaligenaceae bacterium]|nr:hypothetical protein [Alcaligenaceae bacterium]
MEFLLGVIVTILIIYLIIKVNLNKSNKATLIPFSTWLTKYESESDIGRHTLSRGLLVQTIHLAGKMRVISQEEKKELDRAMKKEDPIRVVNGWLEIALPEVIEFGGQNIVHTISARDAGLYMFISLQGVNPQRELKRFFERFEKNLAPHMREEETPLDRAKVLSEKLIVSGYRSLASQQEGVAPTESTTDKEIISIYRKVLSEFGEAARQRNEQLPAGTLNTIAWKFLQVNETLGPEMVDSHLSYEIEKYIQEGLRPEYNQELKLF